MIDELFKQHRVVTRDQLMRAGLTQRDALEAMQREVDGGRAVHCNVHVKYPTRQNLVTAVIRLDGCHDDRIRAIAATHGAGSVESLAAALAAL